MKWMISLALAMLTTTASAQVATMRFDEPRVRTMCPRGQCPTTKPKVINSKPAKVTVSKPTGFVLKRTQWDNRRWTFPGTIDGHLPGAPHYVPRSVLNQLSYNQKVILHNQLHNSGIQRFSSLYPEYQAKTPTGVTKSTVKSQPVRRVTPTVQSNCPGGVCPTTPNTQVRRGLFGRLFRR